jgi:hypothetical protein
MPGLALKARIIFAIAVRISISTVSLERLKLSSGEEMEF